jgi:predicted SpoU family rRNA methylase
MKLTALRRFDGVMMKLTMYDIEDDKYCKNVSGSTKIVPQTSINPEVEDVNAPWSIYTEADYNLALDVSAPETIDLAELILDTKEGVAKTDGDD